MGGGGNLAKGNFWWWGVCRASVGWFGPRGRDCKSRFLSGEDWWLSFSQIKCCGFQMFFRPDKPITKHLNHLPHWQQDLVFVFITWRLADSVPEGLLEKWRAEREEWVKSHPKPWDDELGKEYHQRFSAKLEEWMDQGMGECVLRDPCCAEIVGRCLLHFDGERYELDSFAVMPNHVHVLF